MRIEHRMPLVRRKSMKEHRSTAISHFAVIKKLISAILTVSIFVSIIPAASLFAASADNVLVSANELAPSTTVTPTVTPIVASVTVDSATISLGIEVQGDIVSSAHTVPALDEKGVQLTNYVGEILSSQEFTYSHGTATSSSTFVVYVGDEDICNADGTAKTYDGDNGTVTLLANARITSISSTTIAASDGSIYYQANLEGLPFDSNTAAAQYKVVEETPPQGFILDDAAVLTFNYTFTPDRAEYRQERILQNDRQQAVINTDIIKQIVTWDPATQFYARSFLPAEDIVIGIFTAQDIMAGDRVVAARDTLVEALSSDSSGHVKTTQQIPFGEYYLLELNVTEGLVMDTHPIDNNNVFCTQSQQTAKDPVVYFEMCGWALWECFYPKVTHGYFNIDIKDSLGRKVSGCEFQIIDAAGNEADTVRESQVYPDIYLYVSDNLPYGQYTIVQTQGPAGTVLCEPKAANIYLKSTDYQNQEYKTLEHVVSFDLIMAAVAPPLTVTPTPAPAPSVDQTASLGIEVQGDIVSSARTVPALDAQGVQLANEKGDLLTSQEFTYSHGTATSSSMFVVYVGDKDICNADGTVKTYNSQYGTASLTAGNGFCLITSTAKIAADGSVFYQADISGLPLDSRTGTAQYVIEAYTAPQSFCLNTTNRVTYNLIADPDVTVVRQEKIMENDRQKAVIDIKVMKETNTIKTVNEFVYFDPQSAEAPDIVIGIYTRQDITCNGKIILPRDTLVDVVKTGEDGRASTSQDIPFGEYYEVQLKVTPGLILANDLLNRFNIDCLQDAFGYTGQLDSPVIHFRVFENPWIFLEEIWGYFDLDLEDPYTGIRIPNASFNIYEKDGYLVDVVQQRWNRNYESIPLPYGQYTIVQTSGPAGFDMVDVKTADIDHQHFWFNNLPHAVTWPPRQATIKVLVTSEDKNTPLPGTTLGVYDKTTNALIASPVTDAAGIGSVSVDRGSYYIKEIEASAGYQITDDTAEVTARWDTVYELSLTCTAAPVVGSVVFTAATTPIPIKEGPTLIPVSVITATPTDILTPVDAVTKTGETDNWTYQIGIILLIAASGLLVIKQHKRKSTIK